MKQWPPALYLPAVDENSDLSGDGFSLTELLMPYTISFQPAQNYDVHHRRANIILNKYPVQ